MFPICKALLFCLQRSRFELVSSSAVFVYYNAGPQLYSWGSNSLAVSAAQHLRLLNVNRTHGCIKQYTLHTCTMNVCIFKLIMVCFFYSYSLHARLLSKLIWPSFTDSSYTQWIDFDSLIQTVQPSSSPWVQLLTLLQERVYKDVFRKS